MTSSKNITEYKWGPYYQKNQEQQPPRDDDDDDDDDDSIAIDDMFDWTVTEVLANRVVACQLSDGAELNSLKMLMRSMMLSKKRMSFRNE